jgi:hypothetical protein
MTSPDEIGAPDPRRWKALGVLGLIQFMLIPDVTVVNVALPRIQHDLGFAPGWPGLSTATLWYSYSSSMSAQNRGRSWTKSIRANPLCQPVHEDLRNPEGVDADLAGRRT